VELVSYSKPCAVVEVAPIRHGKPAVVAESVPLVIRTVADINALMATPRVLKRLPPNGLVVDIPGLDEKVRDTFRLETKRYARACGCSAGGATFILATAACIAYACHLALDQDWAGFTSTIVVAMFVVPFLTVTAKFLGLQFVRLRFRRQCARVIWSLSAKAAVHDPGRRIL
jgi:hypothetical protein